MYTDTSAPGGATSGPAAHRAAPGGRSIDGRTAVEKNLAEDRGFSIYLQEVGRVVDGRAEGYVLVMPDENGDLPEEVLRKRSGIVVSWPTNPHNSGEAAILDRLNDPEAVKLFQAPVTCAGFAADQRGRHQRIS
jgi:hypothetical protein